MGKNNKKTKTKIKSNNNSNTMIDNNNKYPFVSVCTPTFNRRPFISGMIKCFNHQNYPKDRMEWIIIDDGTDKIEELVKDHPNVKYFAYDSKMSLGKKRNLLHDKSKGDIIVYMDDDDYYPPERVSHAVESLQSNKQAVCAGSSEIYIYFKHIQKMYQFGPYGPNHATAGTFAFRRKLLEETKYDDTACLAEEKVFLKNYTVPFVQLKPKNTILVISHEHNTFDKRKLLENIQPQFVKESDKTVEDFIKEPELVDFYMNINIALETYEPGRPLMKPDVLEQIIKLEETRRNMSPSNGQITFQDDAGNTRPLNNNQVVEIMKNQQQQLQQQQSQLTQIKSAFIKMAQENMELKTQLEILNKIDDEK